ncbi:hypothetical protein Ancab_028332 [Ancistrocladus abbreviatus]
MQPNTVTVTDTKSPVACCCLKAGDHEAGSSSESRTSSSSEGEEDAEEQKGSVKEDDMEGNAERGGGSLVMVDGEEELELETLLRASAYILGASGANIVYKAVLQDGTTFAVRRIGESVAERMKDFENQVRGISKLRHPNLVRVRGFYWGMMRSLSSTTISPMAVLLPSLTVDIKTWILEDKRKKTGSSSFHLPLEIQLKTTRGVAGGLTYIHEKKFVHGSLKPSNIPLTPKIEPLISNLGLNWLVCGNNTSNGGGGLGRQLGSKRYMGSYDMVQAPATTNSPKVNPFRNTRPTASSYQAPESLKNLKPDPKVGRILIWECVA